MKHQPEILEDNSHQPAEFINFMIRYFKNIDSIDEDLTFSRQDFPENNSEQGCFA